MRRQVYQCFLFWLVIGNVHNTWWRVAAGDGVMEGFRVSLLSGVGSGLGDDNSGISFTIKSSSILTHFSTAEICSWKTYFDNSGAMALNRRRCAVLILWQKAGGSTLSLIAAVARMVSPSVLYFPIRNAMIHFRFSRRLAADVVATFFFPSWSWSASR